MNENFKEILFLPEGIYKVKYQHLTTRTLKSYRSRLLNRNANIRRDLAYKREQIEDLLLQLKQNQSILDKLTDNKIKEIIAQEKERERQAELKAIEFLKAVIGLEAWKELAETGKYLFKGADGKKYKITKDATLYQACGKYWGHMCVIHPKDLPLPDVIASVFTTVTNNPYFEKESVKTKTEV